jgi:hypothetical protein
MEMASIGMEMMAEWGSEAVLGRLTMLTKRLAEGLQNSGALVPDNRVRAPHVLSLAFPRNMPEKAVERLAAHNVYV